MKNAWASICFDCFSAVCASQSIPCRITSRMPHWLIKSSLHRVISWLPASHFWNGLLQHLSRSLDLPKEQFEMRLDYCRRHLEAFLETRPAISGHWRVVELGTGWFPTVPVGLYLCGAAEIWTFGIAPWLIESQHRVRKVGAARGVCTNP